MVQISVKCFFQNIFSKDALTYFYLLCSLKPKAAKDFSHREDAWMVFIEYTNLTPLNFQLT